MSDLLVKLYDLKSDQHFIAEQEAKGIIVRKPIGPEVQLIVAWVKSKFGEAWASETEVALANRPISCFIAIQNEALIGFACYDATALGFFGPTGVDENHRGQGTGQALLLACLFEMKSKGYGYAIIGDAGPLEFYRQAVGAIEIPDSSPGIYRSMLKR